MKLFRPHLPLCALVLLTCLVPALAGCTIARPLAGPGMAKGFPRSLMPGAPATVVITHASLDPAQRRRFDRYIWRVVAAMDGGAFDGLVAYSVRKQLFGDQVWTYSVWTDRAAMQRFSSSDIHREAIREAGDAIRTLRVRETERTREAVPLTWSEALALLDTLDREGDS